MGSASGSNAEVIRAAVHEAMATEVSRLSGYPGNVAAAQPQVPTEDPNQRFVVSIAGKPVRGPENAPVTMVEFSDFQCPFCGRFFAETEGALLKKYDGKIRFVYRHFPLDSIHPFAQGAALASECANEQNKFWEYHDLLFQNQQQLGNEGLLAYA